MSEMLRAPAEVKFADELDYLESVDTGPKPFSWRLSPNMVRLFVLGSERADGLDREIPQKWFGDRSFVERSIVTLASDRGLLLIGDPGTGKSWLAELLSAAICRNSTLVVQGTAGTTEDHIKYSWNVSMVIAKGQSRESMIPSPIMTAMEQGVVGRFEELTRSTSDVQDALISILSEKYVSIPELDDDNIVFAKPGFSIIATANSRDRGVNDLSSALKRRFNFVRIPVVTNKRSEAEIVRFRTEELLRRHRIELDVPPTLLDILLQSFADLRAAAASATSDDEKLESALSTAEQIGVLEDAILHSQFFGDRTLRAADARRRRWSGRWPGAARRTWRSSTSTCTGSSSPGPRRTRSGRASSTAAARRSPPCHDRPRHRRRVRGAARAAHRRGRRLRRQARRRWPGSCPAWSTTSTGRWASGWRSSRSATTRRPRRWPWCAGCGEKQPKVIYLELCEDLQPLLGELRNCRLPVALQAFASELDGFPAGWGPLSVVAPITEASAEYQAIAYALETPGVELVLVDRSTDHVFQWAAQDTRHREAETAAGPTDEGGAARRRGGRGDRRPAAPLRRAGGAPAAPRQGAALVGVVGPVRRAAAGRRRLRHLPPGHGADRQPVPPAAPGTADRADRDEDRERYMWTRMRAAPRRLRRRPGRLPLRLRRLPRRQPGRAVRPRLRPPTSTSPRAPRRAGGTG